jgi:hypothetical protein
VALVRERTIPTERPPLVGEVSLSHLTWGWRQTLSPKRCVVWFSEYLTTRKVHKPSNSECDVPSSEPFSIHNKTNSMVWVRERTIPTERPPLVGEVIANLYGWRMPRGQRDGSLRPYSGFSRQEPLLFYQVAPHLYSRGWVDPVPDPTTFFLVVPGIEPGPPDL